MFANPQPPRIHLPKGWQDDVKSAVLHAIALAHYAIVYARAWAADSINARVRLAAENDRLHEECALLREELLPKCNQFSYGQVRSPYGSGSFVHDLRDNFDEEEENLVASEINGRDQIYDSIKDFLGKGR